MESEARLDFELELSRKLLEVTQQRDALAISLDRFFYDIRYTAPELWDRRLNQLGSAVGPVIDEFATERDAYDKLKIPLRHHDQREPIR